MSLPMSRKLLVSSSKWRILCQTIGSKCSSNKVEADRCCTFRLAWLALEFIAITAIISNAIHQW